MTKTGTVLYVRAVDADGGDARWLDALDGAFDVDVADGAIAALKLLAGGRPVDAVVAPATLPDLERGTFAEHVEAEAPGTPVVIVGALPPSPERIGRAIAGAAAYVPPGHERELADRLARLLDDRRVDDALERHAELRCSVGELAVDVAGAVDRSAVEAVLYDHLSGIEGYRHVWIGSRDGDERFAVSVPVGGTLDGADLAALVGGGDPTFVDRAYESGRVTWTSGRVPHRGGSTVAGSVASDGPPDRTLTSAAVPFVHGGEVRGLALVSTDRPDAMDGAERAVLEDVGALVGHALWALEATETESTAFDSAEGLENLVHDLRNPLGIAQSHLAIAREDDEPASLDRVESALERMGDIVDRTALGLRGASTVQTTTDDLGEIARRAWGSIDADAADLVLAGTPTLRADPDLLERLLTNLFQNAVEHGGEDVTIRVGGIDDGFFVEDDGPGIPESERETVFERGYSTTSSGHGIGLSIVRDVAEAHGWDVAATAGRDGGARFEVTGVEAIEEGATV